MKSVLILGTGNAQIDAIEYCRNQGFYVCACSYDDPASGRRHVDEFAPIDIKDVEAVCNYVEERKIDAVYSIGSDMAMPTVMAVSTRLKLPHFLSAETATICHDKYILRETLSSDFEGNLVHRLIVAKEDVRDWNIFPYILKPADNQGQRGVFRIDRREDFDSCYEKAIAHSHSKRLIVEEYIEGPEVSVNAYLQDGEIRFLLISDRITFTEYQGGIIKEHIIPSSSINTSTQGKIEDLVNRILGKLSISNGPVYLQLKLREGEPKLIEIAPRLDGCHLWRLIRAYCEVDLLDASFMHLVYDRRLDFHPRYTPGKYRLRFLCERPGTVFDRGIYETASSLYLRWYYENGEIVKSVNGVMEKCGYVIEKLTNPE